MASQTRRTGICANYGRWWRTGKPGVLQSTGSQRVGHDWATGHQNPMTPASLLGLGRVGSARTARAGVGEEPKGRWWCQVSKSPQEWESEESLDGKWFRICSQYSFLGWPWYPKSENGGKRLRVATRRARGLPTAGAWRVYTVESFCGSSLRLKTPSFWVEFSFERGRSKAALFLSRLFLAHVSVVLETWGSEPGRRSHHACPRLSLDEGAYPNGGSDRHLPPSLLAYLDLNPHGAV